MLSYFKINIEIEKVFINRGAQILVGMEVNEVKKEGNRVEISLAGNGSIFTDALVTAVGVKARTSLAEAAGIKTNIGGVGLYGI